MINSKEVIAEMMASEYSRSSKAFARAEFHSLQRSTRIKTPTFTASSGPMVSGVMPMAKT